MPCKSCMEKKAAKRAEFLAKQQKSAKKKPNTTTVSNTKAYLDAMKKVKK